MVVESGLGGALPVLRTPPTGDGDKDGLLSPRLGPDSARGVETVKIGHAEVKQHYCWSEASSLLKCRLAIRSGAYLVTVHTQQHGQAVDFVRVVVNHEDLPRWMIARFRRPRSIEGFEA